MMALHLNNFLCKRMCISSNPLSQYIFNIEKIFVLPHVKYSKQNAENKSENMLLKYLQNKIKATGPITIAEYMREVLTNPYSGYYMHKDTFGTSGDFTTSPEISQIFGELIAVWFYNEWSKLRQPSPLQLIEFGPGRGTLSDDILRVFKKLKMSENISLHLVEVSPFLRRLQKQLLCSHQESIQTERKMDQDSSGQETAMSKYGIPVMWHTDITTVPNKFSLILAHEFFDALPIHKLQKVQDQWREVLLDVKDGSGNGGLRYILSRHQTPASKLYIDPEETREHVEVSPESGVLIGNLASRLEQFGGIALIIDYGYTDREKCDTFRSFKNHKLHDPLVDPGTADLTADVDFSYLIKCAADKVVAVGPVSQATFLKSMSIDIRLEKLLANAPPDQRDSLVSGYNMLMKPDQMGERFKFLAFYPGVLKEYLRKIPPPGFESRFVSL